MQLYPGQYGSPNKILAKLPAEEIAVVRGCLTRMRLVARQNLIESGQTAEHVFFIEEGIASLIADVDAIGQGVQVGMIGREGLVGAFSLLGGLPHGRVTVHMPGPALRISISNLQLCFETCPVLRALCWEYLQTLTHQIMASAASSARHTLVERCVRWLLMTHDRVDGDDLFITHEALSSMLGVRRAGVTVATATLQERGLIKTGRGRVRIVHRMGLEAVLTSGFALSGFARDAAAALADAPAPGSLDTAALGLKQGPLSGSAVA